ncbi:sodium- and chloride-dependent betaine transporter-like [Mytilus trossulus]|uniref:sodium- and chloride-dependent betaine transporter-like n=1 Tax=Mytilus trossulus TaxID=6551 RepID=UPI003004483E
MGGFNFQNVNTKSFFISATGVRDRKNQRKSAAELNKKWNCECDIDDEEIMELRSDKSELDYENSKIDSKTDSSESSYKRETWSRKADFILSIVGYSVGVSNILRFPYLCVRNGGGAFLIPFFFFIIFCGLPLFYLEICLGQFSGVSSLFVWNMCPLFKGLGYLMVTVSALMSWYYITMLCWIIYYFINSFKNPLPWSLCDQSWNEAGCILSRLSTNTTMVNCSEVFMGHNYIQENGSYTCNVSNIELQTAPKQFWQNNVLHISSGIEESGHVQWHLVICLLVAWILVFLCLMKGIKSVGKVVYFTAILPYVLLTIVFVRGLMMPGSLDGIIFYLKPDFSRLLDIQVWLEAGLQVFYSLGPAWGGLITMSSYNKFDNNCLRDAIIGTLADTLTSFYGGFVIFAILGAMSYEANLPITEVATSGPGLGLVAYPEAINKLPMPQVWAVIFFLMLLFLGIDSQFGTFETVCSGLVDAFPQKLGKRRILLTACLSCLLFLLGLPFTMNGGMYLYQIVDWYAASLCVMLTSFLECIVIGWIYGAERFSRDIHLMQGRPAPKIFRVCWCIVTPAIMLATFIMTLIQYQPPTYEGYEYPVFARALGLLLAVVPLIPLPVLMIIQFLQTPGTFMERLQTLLRPSKDWGPHPEHLKEDYQNSYRHHKSHNVWTYMTTNIFGPPASEL